MGQGGELGMTEWYLNFNAEVFIILDLRVLQ